MTPERRAAVVALLRGCWPELAKEAADELEQNGAAPRPSESSMVQRIEVQADALRFIRSTAAATRRTLADACDAMVSIHRAADRALDGPPDPERDREQPGEAERP